MVDYEDLEEKTPAAMQELDDQEGATLSAGRSGGSRALSRSLASEFDEVAKPDHAQDDYEDSTEESKALVQVTKGPQESRGYRPPLNSSTPAADKVLGRMLEQMIESIEWIQQITPQMVRQSVWAELSGELAWPVNTITTAQVVEDTVSLLRAMRCEPQTHPSEAALEGWTPTIAGRDLHKWKRKLWLSFGASDISLGRPPKTPGHQEEEDPSRVPLPQTPKTSPEGSSDRTTTEGVFSAKTVGSPYFQDSHMVTPRSTTVPTACRVSLRLIEVLVVLDRALPLVERLADLFHEKSRPTMRAARTTPIGAMTPTVLSMSWPVRYLR
ncbi:hypothetical protein PF005_g26109 [Phytophthora fragariae]|uniref:Eukaryotic/viral aspartic protease n=1 Tax=Phytophthora fragariae TaxID=53985 RepID=A0A6A3DR94_9STRA|nr:hypothetical protein PF009_g25226 [Phytophthora fragariae]KAE9095845.1 hypothetical protein PF007_g17237 [Phytophthora fragariae]KAE9096128.1 hypothetical protein PF006_g23851 [Phytophthora fragariae]KAE9173839.1 hypothetical protein PF005_g26109 [Phytophthora fragariae]KAE9193666.1 hypothetical protein PF002_g23834 [Phytophthora fragariae]